ncbi:hypothetical protein HSX37_16220|uniref:Phage portal protein, SPP1 Gp6-like n=1 Tax=Dendrosporobacter quercicolus TaxID=146817 RepID=A0A1G9ZSJ4_9FIRM|nr:hypothetical protein [Dendrosporobacter quercicolus]NSL49582.1 hypothetical protein [Dendrosporobacter quercicolus DSM 1736]SDN23623.1 hypothetical protein SAMN04488502_11538 [Dendrosporobacter quercicolus]
MTEASKVLDIDRLLGLDDYQFLTGAYYGSGGFKDGSYLVRHPRETPEKYLKRRELAYYLNYVAPTVNSHVNPVFNKEPEREWRENPLFSAFAEDTDTLGTSLARFMKRAGFIAKLQAVAFIVIDNAAEQPGNMAEVLRQRALPYAYIVQRKQVKSYKTNKPGKLIEMTYTIASEVNESGEAQLETWTWTTTKWKCQDANGEKREGNHPLGRLPIVPLYAKPYEPGNVLPQSEFYSIAKANKRLYNLCSEIDELIRSQAFNVFTYPIGENQSENDIREIVTGTENAVVYDGTLHNSPQFTAPDSSSLVELRQERKDLIVEIYRMAELSHVTGVETKTSGVAKEWDFQNTNQVLRDFALNCEDAERETARVFELWTNTRVDLYSNYSDDFGIVDVAAALDNAGKGLDLNIGGQFDVEVKKKAASVYLNDLPEERFDAVMEDIDRRAEETQQAEDLNSA